MLAIGSDTGTRPTPRSSQAHAGGDPDRQARTAAGVVAMSQAVGYTPDVAKLQDAIRAAIKASGQTRYRIAKGSGVAQSQLSRLMSGETGLSVDSIEKLARYLGLEITIRPKRRPARKGR